MRIMTTFKKPTLESAGTLLAEGCFKAPDETPEELAHMGSPQLLHLYPPEEMRVSWGMAPEEVEEIVVEA